MDNSWQNSVVLITSGADGNNVYGTGFVVHRDEQGTYLLTCTHVIDDVGGKELVRVNNIPAKVITSAPVDGADVAVLLVVGLADKPILGPYVNSIKSEALEFAGYYHLDDNPKKKLVFKRFRGSFTGVIQAGMTLNTLVPFWEIEVEGKDELRPGNSGSPVVNKNNYVIGIVNTRLADKKRGWVTPIRVLEDIWPEMSPDLFVQRTDDTSEETTQLAFDYLDIDDKYISMFYVQQAEKLINVGEYEQALQAYEVALSFDLYDHELYREKAVLLEKLGRYDEALEAYRQALELQEM
ncbi:hypothetical protein KSC_023930 [Ktedonobacter sp. SOSP1-52]|uniref:tetratricopeptide repeat-containing S1 family peptidase n=1 Tax=Ktedonobacter sp. SOSP1-52 TaxID=2778366 RepID=UPI00191583CE|nr:trypsin-like peptidase domain-containing protein [Ktedonobacter sp. SOSP1-52]GHO63501.1 hypothetical protein KSC_023930 [Ktedonobacter sp. SOSP1-52]